MRTELFDLIERMCVVEPVTSSNESVSWHAHREAELLTDQSIASEICVFLSGRVSKVQRKAAYFILGKLCKNIKCQECVESLVGFIDQEKDKYALATLLNVLADNRKSKEIDLSSVYKLLDDSRWLIRHSAIQSLRNAESSEAEARLLSLLESVEDATDIVYCNATLNHIGTVRSIPLLERYLKSRKRDVKSSAEQAIMAIEERAYRGGEPA